MIGIKLYFPILNRLFILKGLEVHDPERIKTMSSEIPKMNGSGMLTHV